MSIIITVLAGLLVLTVLVVAHECGHFFVGKACDIRINEFSVGFGPKLFSRKRKKDDIIYSLRALPLGGYVQFYGEDEEVDAAYEPRAFNNRPLWQRALTLLAGPAMNLIAALLITVIVLTAFGDYVPVIKSVTEGTPAYEAGLQEGDRVVMFEGKKIDFSTEFELATGNMENKESVTIGVEREGSYKEFTVALRYDEETGRNMMGIKYSSDTRKKFSFFEALGLSFKWMYLIIVEMFQYLGRLLSGSEGVGGLAGPVGTITIIGEAVRSGFEVTMRLAALLSINLGIMNLLPFPALDGGRLLFLGVEKIRGKAIPRKVEGYINMAGLVLLFALMIFLTYQDIARLLA